jgi:hypothetical protein
MIITSNTVEHNYTIPQLRIIGEVDGLENVAYQAQIYLHSSVTFDHTYETTLYDMNVDPRVGIATTVTESKTITEFTHYDVDLNTVGLAATTFSAFDDLEEDEVVQWCIDADTDRIEGIQDEQEAKVLEAKDKILNPRKYYRDTPVTPWRRRADEAAVENL